MPTDLPPPGAPSPDPPYPGPPPLVLLTGVKLLTNGAFRYLYPFLPVIAADLGLSPARAGLLVSALAVGGMASPTVRRVVTGGVERPRHLLVTSALLMSAGVMAAAVAPGAPVAIAAIVVIGAGKPLVDVGALTYVSERVDYRRRARATSVMEVTWGGGLVVVAPIAGLIAARTSWRVPLAFLAGMIALAMVPVHRRLDADAVIGRPRRHERLPRAPWTRIEVRLLVVLALVFGMLESTFAVFGLWLDADFGIGLEGLGGLAAITATGEMVGATLVLTLADRLGKHRTAMAGMALCCAALVVLQAAKSLPVAIGALAVALAGSETAIVAVFPLATEVQPVARTRFLAAMMASGSLGRAIAAFVGGATFAAVGIRGNVVLSVGCGLSALAALFLTVRAEPRLRG